MEEFYTNLWRKKLPRLEALRQAQLTVLKEPERVRRRARELAAELRKGGVERPVLAARGIEDETVEAPAGPVRAERSPVVWWAPWVLSGDPGR